MFLALWEFEVKSGCEARFQTVYGAHGDWARLFRTDSNFLETRLLQDPRQPAKYITLDFWASRSAFESFKESNHTAYQQMDKNCETLTIFERCLGMFDS